MNIRSQSHKVQLVLKKHQLLTLHEAPPKIAIECKEGVLWVTNSSEALDYMLLAGRNYVPRVKGNVVIEAIADARVDIEEC